MMADRTGAGDYRPVLLGQVGIPKSFAPSRGGGNGRIRFTHPTTREQRLEGQLTRATQAFSEDIALTDSVQAADPQLVIVFEALDEHADLHRIAEDLGLEILVETESAIDPDDEVELARPETAKDPQIASCMHAICLGAASMDRILVAWNSWRQNRSVPYGLGPLKEFFEHLRDVRPWGPVDRVRGIDWDEYFAGRVPGTAHAVELELWYRNSGATRLAAIATVESLVEQAGGEVTGTNEQSAIGYLALKAEVPDELLRALAEGRFDEVALVRAADVLFLRVQGQGLLHETVEQAGGAAEGAMPTGPARVMVLDGVPASNHERLTGRIQVVDPDDLESDAELPLRKHGTGMTSAIVWGDINAAEPPLARPVVVRPVLVPSPSSVSNVEEFPPATFIPDLMRRVFAEQFPTGVDDGVTVVNLSLGDPALPFDSMISSWARTLDWLSYEYGVLIVVSAGNHRALRLVNGIDTAALLAMGGADRSAAIHASEHQEWAARRILSPAESINAITVGALHDDASGAGPIGYVFDPHDGLVAPSPVSRLGGGHRRAVKPEVAAPGGRVMFSQPLAPADTVVASMSTLFGVQVASPVAGRETQMAGTSPAAALISRRLSDLVDLADDVAGPGLARHERAVAAKAMLIHGARHPVDFDTGALPLRHSIGYGAVERNLAFGCESNEATILFLGELGALEQQELRFPLPNGLATRDIKRVTATLAWLSPVNWRHRQYRRAHLSFAKPTGLTALPTSSDVSDDDAKRGSSTVKHQTWEFSKAVAGGQGDAFTLTVKCNQQAGGLGGERVPYAVAMTLWVSPSVGIDVYAQVAQQVRTSVPIRPGGSA